MIWRDGTIGSAAEPLRVQMIRLSIERGQVSKRLAGVLICLGGQGLVAAETQQRDSILLDGGTIQNLGAWVFARSCRIDHFGESLFELRGRIGGYAGTEAALVVGDRNQSGESRIDAVVDVLIDNDGGLVDAGGPPGSSLRLTGGLKQRDGTTLTDGVWDVGRDNLLDIPGPAFETIGKNCAILLRGNAEFVQFALRQIIGRFEISGARNQTISGDLTLSRKASLRVGANDSKLIVNGTIRSSGFITVERTCTIGAELMTLTSGFARVDGKVEGPVVVAGGELRGTATLLDDLDNQEGTIQPGLRNVVFGGAFVPAGADTLAMTIGGAFTQAGAGSLVMQLAGTAPNQFAQLNISNSAALGGTLVLDLHDEFRPAAGDFFTLVRAQSISGQYANATNGQRLATIDGYGSFQVNYTPTSVILGNFLLNPTPPPTQPATLHAPEFIPGRLLELSVTGTPGRDYILQSSTDLVNWSSVFTNSTGFDGSLRFELPLGSDTQIFFRATGP
jgi:hypothetical protein